MGALRRWRPADYTFEDHGSIWLVQPRTCALREHLEVNTSDEAQWFAGALAVEPRYVFPLVDALRDNGYTVRVASR